VVDTAAAVTLTGGSYACIGTPDTLYGTPSGGIWSAYNGDASVVGGIVMGVSAGIDSIKYTLTGNCGPRSATVQVLVYTAWECDSLMKTKDVALQSATISVYPNPNNGKFTVALSQPGDATLAITDLFGKTILETVLHTAISEFDMTPYPAAAYLLKVEQGGVVYRGKVVVLAR
jgi:Secretion system C-terminal sorting domain